MLKLKYTLKQDQFQWVTVFGDPEGIRNLYWQLTHNYQPQDGQAIGTIKVFDTDGNEVTDTILTNPFSMEPLTYLNL